MMGFRDDGIPKNDYDFLAQLANEPLLNTIPDLTNIKNFLFQSIKKIIN